MKSRFSLFVLFAAALLWNGCQNDEVNPDNIFEVKPYSKISIDGKVKVVLKDDEPSSDSDYSINILSNENELKGITVTSEDGILYMAC